MNDKVDSIREAAEQLVTQVGILYAFIPNSSSVQACKKAAEELRDVLSKTAETDLLRENAELTANNERLREALQEYAWNYPHLHCLCPRCKALAELPAASLAAITAPLEAYIARLKEGLESAQLCYNPGGSHCWCHPSNQEGPHEPHCMWIRERFDETPDIALAAIQDAALKDDALWDQHAVRCGNCDCEMIVRKGHALSDPDGSEDEALCGRCAGAQMYIYMDRINELESEEHRKTIQDAAKAEEREAIAQLLEKESPRVCKGLIALVRNRGNGGEAKCTKIVEE